MKKLELYALFFIIIASSIAATYTGTKPSDLNLETPAEGNTKVSEFNNSDREIKTVIVNLENITTVTGTYTVTGTQTGILGSSTTPFIISFPAASTLATGTITKRYMVKNINSGTITLNLTVDGIGSPTVAGSQTFKLFTNGTSWFEDRVGRAAVASNADLLDGLDSTYFTNATNISTGTVALARIPGTLTGKSADLLDEQTGSYYTNASNLDSGSIPLARIPTTLTGKDADTIDTINGASIVQTSRTISTTAPLAGGGALSGDLTLSMPLATSGQNGYISSADWSTFNNKLATSRTITTTTPLTIAGVASADLSADRTIAMATATASQDGFVKKEDFQTFSNRAIIVAGSGITSSSSTGTTTITNNGVLQIVAGTGITVTGNGTGTPTITAVGTTTSGGWLDTGTATVATAGYPIIAHGTITVDTAYGMTGVLDRDIPNTITLDNLTQITTRNYDDITGTSTIRPTQIAIGTTTYQGALNVVGSATFTGTVTANAFVGVTVAFSNVTGSATASQIPLISGLLGSATSVQLPIIIEVAGTTTAITGTSASGSARLYNLKSVENLLVSGTKYLLHFNGGSGTSNFEDSSTFARTIVAVGSATHSPTQVKFGSTSCYLDSTGDSVTTTSSVTDFSPGTQTFYADVWAFYNGTKGSVTATLFGKRSGAGSWANDGHEWFLSVEDDNKLQFYYNSSNNPVAITGTNTLAFTAGWHHYKVVNASTGFFMYFDGVLAQSAAKINITATTGGTPKFVIGERNSDNYWSGYVDEMNFVVGADGETNGFIPRTIEYGVSYDKYTLSYIPIGTTTPSIKQEYGTPTNTTVTYLQGDLIVDKPTRYSTATAYCAEFSLSKPILAQAYTLYPCDSMHKEIIDTGSVSAQKEAFDTILNTGIYKFLWKTPELEKAKPLIVELTKVDYGRKDYKQEQILWEEVYRVNYVTIVGGSQTVNSKQMAADFEAYYLNNQYFEFDNMSAQEKNVLIYEKKKTVANADKRNESNNIGIVLDRNCPEEFKLNGLPEISKMIQLEISAQKEAAERIVKMEKEHKSLTILVGSLTARLNAASIP